MIESIIQIYHTDNIPAFYSRTLGLVLESNPISWFKINMATSDTALLPTPLVLRFTDYSHTVRMKDFMMRKWMLWASVMLTILAINSGLSLGQSTTTLPITQDVIYTVRSGDTLETIGALFDVSPTCLATINDIEAPQRLVIGDELLISVACPRYGEAPEDEGTLPVFAEREVVTFEDTCDGYRVRRGDTPDTIAQGFDVPVLALLRDNELEAGELLSAGQCLTIPADGLPYGATPALFPPIPGELLSVDVAEDLDSIARRFNVSLDVLLEINGIDRDRRVIVPGMTIVIPAGAPEYGDNTTPFAPSDPAAQTGFLYLVELETLDEIAQRFDVSLAALEAVNNVQPGRNVLPGTRILIPANAPVYGEDVFDAAALGQGGGSTGEQHIVQPGETLSGIARFYDVETTCLATTNTLARPGQLLPGQVLIIPEDCPPFVDGPIPPLEQVIEPVGSEEGG